jgi:hypothetical protein
MDKFIYSKLTDSAKAALDETMQEVANRVLEKAFNNASSRNTADKEISLRDIVEAKEEILYQKVEIDIQDFKQKRIGLFLSMSGAAYAVFGIVIYLFLNKSFDTENDIGLIIAAIGILMSVLAFYYTQLSSRKKIGLIEKNIRTERDNSEFEIVRRWQVIETLGSELMRKEGMSHDMSKSMNLIIKFLTSSMLDISKTNDLQRILMTRNEIVHRGLNLSKMETEDLINKADFIIDELEKKMKKY